MSLLGIPSGVNVVTLRGVGVSLVFILLSVSTVSGASVMLGKTTSMAGPVPKGNSFLVRT